MAARTVADAVPRLRRGDRALKEINLQVWQRIDADVGELVDCLLAHPDVATTVSLGHNRLTDETGVKLARYIAASSTVQTLGLSNNQLGEATYVALAAALRVNTSLEYLFLHENLAVDERRVDAAFADALWLNRSRPVRSTWMLYSYSNDFKRLKATADQRGHPSLQTLLLQKIVSP